MLPPAGILRASNSTVENISEGAHYQQARITQAVGLTQIILVDSDLVCTTQAAVELLYPALGWCFSRLDALNTMSTSQLHQLIPRGSPRA